MIMLSLNNELLQAITEMPNAIAGATAFLAIFRILISLSLGIVLTILSRENLKESQRIWILDNGSTYKLCKASFCINLLTIMALFLFFVCIVVFFMII